MSASLTIRFENHLAGASRQRRESEQTTQAVLAASRDHMGGVAALVGALQVGDSTRQGLEHVSAALQATASQPSNAGVVLPLQVAQISAARTMLQAETEAIRNTMSRLAHEIGASFGDLTGRLVDTGAKNSVVEDLADDIAEAAAGLSGSESELRHIEHVTEKIAALSDSLAAFAVKMGTIEFEMGIVSVNTAVTCSRLGARGKALAVVSQQLRELVSEMMHKSEAAATPLAAIGDIAAKLAEARQATRADMLAGLVSNAQTSLGVLRSIEQRLDEASHSLRDIGGRIADLAADARVALDGQKTLVQELTTIETELENEVKGPRLVADDVPAGETVLRSFGPPTRWRRIGGSTKGSFPPLDAAAAFTGRQAEG